MELLCLATWMVCRPLGELFGFLGIVNPQRQLWAKYMIVGFAD
jgi:hypothetical protein